MRSCPKQIGKGKEKTSNSSDATIVKENWDTTFFFLLLLGTWVMMSGSLI